jgi:hypothetical protein
VQDEPLCDNHVLALGSVFDWQVGAIPCERVTRAGTGAGRFPARTGQLERREQYRSGTLIDTD